MTLHDDVIKWKHFPRYWPFVRGIHRSRWFPTQRPVTRSFGVFFDLRLNKRLSKQSWGWWFETLPRPLWRHSNVNHGSKHIWSYPKQVANFEDIGPGNDPANFLSVHLKNSFSFDTDEPRVKRQHSTPGSPNWGFLKFSCSGSMRILP